MTADHPLSGLLRLAIIVIGVPWVLAMSGFILVACLVAQIVSLMASCFIFAVTFRWPSEENVLIHVAFPRISALWSSLSDLWPRKPQAPLGGALHA